MPEDVVYSVAMQGGIAGCSGREREQTHWTRQNLDDCIHLILLKGIPGPSGQRSACLEDMTVRSVSATITLVAASFLTTAAWGVQAPLPPAVRARPPIAITRPLSAPGVGNRAVAAAQRNSALTKEDLAHLTEAMKRLTPKERKQLTSALKKLTPEERRRVLEEVKRQWAGKAPRNPAKNARGKGLAAASQGPIGVVAR